MRTMMVALALAGLLLGSLSQASNMDAAKEKSKTCAACHGADGNSTAPDFPRLAGQNYRYLVKALSDYKSGERKNAIMNGNAANLSRKDIEDLAAFYAHQTGLSVKY